MLKEIEILKMRLSYIYSPYNVIIIVTMQAKIKIISK